MGAHTLFDGRVQIYKRGTGRVWQCAARVDGIRFRASTGEEDLDHAKDVAEEWYLDLRGKRRSGELQAPKAKEKTFREAAEGYLREFAVLGADTRSDDYIASMTNRMHLHVLPFFGEMALSKVNGGAAQAFIMQRTEEHKGKYGKAPARSPLKHDLVLVRQTLKWAEREGWLPHVPTISLPYLTLKKKGRRAWFSPEEYKQLYTATRERWAQAKDPHDKRKASDLHDYVLFMANTGLRTDEARNLQFRDIEIEDDIATGETILVIDVRGKRGVGFCKSMPGAVQPFKRLRERRQAERRMGTLDSEWPGELRKTDKLFRPISRPMFNTILEKEGLKYDRDGQSRTFYSLRHTYISMRLLEGANILMVANNCRTSVEMIEEHYAAHIKDRIDASAINVQRPAKYRQKPLRQDSPSDNFDDDGFVDF